MIANYGYTDGSGDYFITIDTDKCNGCAECVRVCPKGLFEVAPDDYDKSVALVKEEFVNRVSYVCPGHKRCLSLGVDCHSACTPGAISHTW